MERSPIVHAAPPPLVQSTGRTSISIGAGLAHAGRTGLGFNFELKYGLGGGAELGFRSGVRTEAGRATTADAYGRPFDRETFGTGYDTFANPELRFRQAVSRALALEARAYIPFDGPFGAMLALPMLFTGGALRLDTGIYVPVVFSDRTQSWISVPAQLWFGADSPWHIGLISGVRHVNHNSDWEVPIGLGLDRSLSRDNDLMLWFLFPDISRDGGANVFGGGVALRIGI